MPYRRKRYFRKGRRYRRYRGRLSTYNVASKTSAKAQARQILALRRRTNVLFKRTRKDVEVMEWRSNDELTAGQAGSFYYHSFAGNVMGGLLHNFTNSDTFSGDKCICRGIRFNGMFRWSSGAPGNLPAFVKIVVCRLKGDYDDIPAAPYYTTGEIQTVLGGMRPNIGDVYTVLTTRLLRIDADDPVKVFNFYVRDGTTHKINWNGNSYRETAADPWTNDICIYWTIMNSSVQTARLDIQAKGVFIDN